ncbi:MAG: carboxymuconolactone decarboxylase family protein [Rhodospirillales bacterium]|nr:carboxymuconolactone decarboxylase family protein [Rhodospirillales bacterium]
MATIPYYSFAEAEGLAREVYDDIVKTYGIKEPHGIYQLMGHTPEFLAANWQRSRYLYGTDPKDTNVSRSLLSLRDKHFVTLAVSATNNCAYCVRLHTQRLEQLKMTREEQTEVMMIVDVVNGYDKVVEGTRAGDDPVLAYAEETNEALCSIFGDIRKAYGNREPEDIYRLMGHDPAYLKASWDRIRRCFFDEGRLGLRTKHMVAFGVAATNSSDYGTQIYSRRLKELGVSDPEMTELLLVIDLACGYNRYVQGLLVATGEKAFAPTEERAKKS